tara:strand:- start:5766 stop:6575 length:810 start_codon:yes stop_codon:yes gene_type:complete
MLKKRLIYSLIYADGFYMLSRNFRLQKAGDIDWLLQSYDFSKISFCIDELIILDASREKKLEKFFLENLKKLSSHCFVPISSGGGIKNLDDAKKLFSNGADKVIINSMLYKDPKLIENISGKWGSQSIIASVDVKFIDNDYFVFIYNGQENTKIKLKNYLDNILKYPIGEIYLNSIDRDGTGQGLKFEILNFLPKNCITPIIFCGGVGQENHIIDGLADDRLSAVATANLFNFIGDGLNLARKKIILSKIEIPHWSYRDAIKYKNIVKS